MECPIFLQIPSEILQQILLDLADKHDLCTVAIVCKTFQLEAEALIYRNIDLSAQKVLQSVSICRVIKDSRRRALLVRTMRFPGQVSPKARHKDKIAKAVRAMINLKELSIVHRNYGPAISDKDLFSPWMLERCSFRLHLYHNNLKTFSPADTEKFLSNQPEIKVWIGGSLTSRPIRDTFLPHLTITQLCSHNLLRQLSTKHLQRLSLQLWHREDFEDYASVARTINLLHATLTHLNIEFELSGIAPKELEGTLIRHLDLPHLQFLRWTSRDVNAHFRTACVSGTDGFIL